MAAGCEACKESLILSLEYLIKGGRLKSSPFSVYGVLNFPVSPFSVNFFSVFAV
ncbi:hypothetical protein GY50_1308 [Dehalococcoides mccartyi GY50]|nr:hypothetical protein GY50_1308 [Dehalococcoides mccartyi GY50]